VSDLPDEVLVEQARQNPQAYAGLVERYRHRIVTLAYRMLGDRDEAEDIAQEAFIRAYLSLPRFKSGLPWSPWIYRIATNLCLTALNRRKVHAGRQIELTLELEPGGLAIEPDRLFEQREMQAQIHQAVLSLPPNYRAAVVLRYIEDLSYEEIALTLNVPVGTVKNWLFRARKMLQTRIAQDQE
jgi:RNA polymerase sigma-70 factor (ECF subfamily)